MNLDEIYQYQGEDSVRGDLAREFMGVINDYQSGTITAEDKTEFINEIVSSYQANNLATEEVTARWIVSAANLAASIV